MAVFCSYVGLDLQLCLVGKEEEFKKLYPLHQLSDSHCVVTTTYPMINDSTINKSQVRISCGKFTRELDKEPLLN